MTDAAITIEDVQGNNALKIVHISGQLDESNVDSKVQEIYQAIESAPKGVSLIFDLQGLEYMNSKSIGYLTDFYGKITEAGGKVAICNAQSNITDILQVVGLTQLIQNYTSLDEAKNALAGAPESTAPAPAPVAPAAPAPTPMPVEITPTPIAPAESAPVAPATPAPVAPASEPAAAAAPIAPTPVAPATPAPTAPASDQFGGIEVKASEQLPPQQNSA